MPYNPPRAHTHSGRQTGSQRLPASPATNLSIKGIRLNDSLSVKTIVYLPNLYIPDKDICLSPGAAAATTTTTTVFHQAPQNTRQLPFVPPSQHPPLPPCFFLRAFPKSPLLKLIPLQRLPLNPLPDNSNDNLNLPPLLTLDPRPNGQDTTRKGIPNLNLQVALRIDEPPALLLKSEAGRAGQDARDLKVNGWIIRHGAGEAVGVDLGYGDGEDVVELGLLLLLLLLLLLGGCRRAAVAGGGWGGGGH